MKARLRSRQPFACGVGNETYNGRKRDDFLRHRVITRTGSSTPPADSGTKWPLISYAPPPPAAGRRPCPLACLVVPLARCSRPRRPASLKSLHLPACAAPAVHLELHARIFLAHHLGRVSISQPLTSPSFCSFAPATLSIATIISLHTDTRPRARILPQLSLVLPTDDPDRPAHALTCLGNCFAVLLFCRVPADGRPRCCQQHHRPRCWRRCLCCWQG